MANSNDDFITRFLGIIYSAGQPIALLRTESSNGQRKAIPISVESLASLRACLQELPATLVADSKLPVEPSE